MINVLFSAPSESWKTYQAPLMAAFDDAGLTVDLRIDHTPETVDYIVYAPNHDLSDFTRYTRAKAVLSLWAGVESIANNKTLTMALARMVESGLTQGMSEWVAGHVLRHHLGMDHHITGQDGVWRRSAPPLATDRHVTVLGLGELGLACAKTLAALGFVVTGWSRSPKQVDGITCLDGEHGLDAALGTADILVLLLPDTHETKNIANADTLARLPKGAVIVNPGRGPLIDDTALLHALDSGHIAHATLDVFRVEPLPENHPFWHHPNVTVTPHIASITRPETSAQAIVENIRRCEAGHGLLNLVDRSAGY